MAGDHIYTCYVCAKGFLNSNFNQAVIDKISMIFKKLPQISHIHKNHNYFVTFYTNCCFPIDFMARTCRNVLFHFCQLWAVELLSWIHTRTQTFFFIALSHAHFCFWGKSVLPIDRYQNATRRAILLQELKKVQLQEHFMHVTQDSIGHLKTLCSGIWVWMKILQLIAKW